MGNETQSEKFICIGKGSARYELDGVVFDRETDALVLYPADRPDEEYTLPDFVKSVAPCAFQNAAALKRVVIPAAITEIGYSAFEGFAGLEEIALHEGIRHIDSRAFYGCKSLRRIELPEKIKSIQASAFAYSGLEAFRFPSGITHIAKELFAGCASLRTVENTEHILSIGRGAFKNCTALEKITLGEGIVSIDVGAFAYCTALREVAMPARSAKPAFERSGLSEEEYGVLNDSLIAVQGECFSSCKSLESFFIPRNTMFINENAFERCNKLSRIFIPLSIREIAGGKLGCIGGLRDVYYEGGRDDWLKIKTSQSMAEFLQHVTVHYNSSAME